jgi:thiosulfate/3-mercaptopyruvate sulfurtransferase
MRPRLQGSIIVDWRQFSQPSRYQQGKLLADEQSLGEKLRRVGIFQEKAVVVFGDPQYGWGEEGRIVWMLRSLGHAKAVMVDGGYRALLQVGIPAGKAGVQAEEIGNFQIKRRFDWEISKEELERVLNQPKLLLIDVREKREFDGATPYGEVWGGPIPGAVHLYYHDLLDAQGYLLPRAAIRRKLEALGWSADREIVAYCTGGVRSAWFSSVLAHLGFNVKNYAGSMLEWTRENPPLNSLD